jgi:hypothetical protein
VEVLERKAVSFYHLCAIDAVTAARDPVPVVVTVYNRIPYQARHDVDGVSSGRNLRHLADDFPSG